MHYVILRDDDTNAFTPVEYLERLYRPFLNRGLPVNLATIPSVRSDVTLPDGSPEGYLLAKGQNSPPFAPLTDNPKLVDYLHKNDGYQVLQHGCHHDTWEFDLKNRSEIISRLQHGAKCLADAGFSQPSTFVAPHDKLSKESYEELVKRFSVVSTGWFELRRLPTVWWPQFLWKKVNRHPHWQVDQTLLLSHPGCLLSCYRSYDTMLDRIGEAIDRQPVTVLVTHWWEYFRNNTPDDRFIEVLHRTADYLASRSDVRVISFSELAKNRPVLN
ncbi:MAG TPA: DUF2334 domain-containing protein [Verrucomicrobiae bacterium]